MSFVSDDIPGFWKHDSGVILHAPTIKEAQKQVNKAWRDQSEALQRIHLYGALIHFLEDKTNEK